MPTRTPPLRPAPSIADSRTMAMMPLIDRLRTIDLSGMWVYNIAKTDASILPYLAWQFDMLSPLWSVFLGIEDIDSLTDIDDLSDIDVLQVPQTDDQIANQRELISMAIPLHRIRGTVPAVTEAIQALGWVSATILEGAASWTDTTGFTLGQLIALGTRWAECRIVIQAVAPNQPEITADAAQAVIDTFNFWKPARCLLNAVVFQWPTTFDTLDLKDGAGTGDTLRMTDSQAVTLPNETDIVQQLPVYNKKFVHSGFTYAKTQVGITDESIVVNGVPMEGNK